jgi:cellulose biosynthesis protein BcsQ
LNSENASQVGQPTLTKPRSVVFANSKGGVGKSTLALMASLGIATLHPSSRVELIDLDVQKTSSDSLRRFENSRFSVLENEDFFLNSGSPNNGNLINHMGSDFPYRNTQKYIIFDSPAGNEPSRSTFLSHSNVIFVPTSVGDADVFATLKYLNELQELFSRQKSNIDGPAPPIVLLPNMVDSREEFNELRNHFTKHSVYFGKPLYYAPVFRRAFRSDENDTSVAKLLQQARPYIGWLTDLIARADQLPPPPKTLFKL